MVFRITCGTGLRVSEIVNTFVPNDIDAKGFIIVRKETAKTNRERLVKVTPELLPYWRVWLQKIPVPGPLIPRPRLDIAGDMWVTTKTGKEYKRKPTATIMARAPYSRFDLGRMWDDVLIAADIGIRNGKPMSIHKGRHTWATWELASGRCSLTEVQCQLGHVSPEMTQGFYLHAVTELMYETDKTPAWRAAALGEFQEEKHGRLSIVG